MFGVLLELSPQSQNGQVVQFQLHRQFIRGLAFQNTAQEQDRLLRREMVLLQNRVGVQVVNVLAVATPIHFQLAFPSHSKQMGSLDRRLAPGTFQPLWVKVFQDPLFTFFRTE